jgi:glutathione S-transferase
MKLYDSPFSPFARKVRMVLEHKGLVFDAIDGLDKDNHDALARVNPRLEVPALEDDGVAVVNSADIVAYLEHRHPDPPVYPADLGARVRARAWERLADTVIDPILTNISYWSWVDRSDTMPAGLLDAAQSDLSEIYARLDAELEDREFVCTTLSIADFALFPHLVAVRSLGVPISAERHAHLSAWLQRMRELDVCRADLARARAYVADIRDRNIERERIFWRGDRIEWLLARGFHRWFMNEIESGRVIWPGFAASP